MTSVTHGIPDVHVPQLAGPVPVCIFARPEDISGYWRPDMPLGLPGPYPLCLTCEFDGCVCEWCEDCDRNVNPYWHFAEWNPAGEHLSDIAVNRLTGVLP